MTLLVNLFKYRARERRSPTEDYLTEVFAEWLRLAAKAGVMRKVLAKLLKSSVSECLPDGNDGRSIQWTTQHKIGPEHKGSRKRPDIVGQSDDFFLIIENKIGAGFTEYNDKNGAVHNQLDLYKHYQQSKETSYGGTVLLTYCTNPPDAWTDPVLNWIDVHAWLLEHFLQDKTDASSENAILKYWTKHVTDFLEDNEMTGTRISLSDIDVKPSYDRLIQGLRRLGNLARVSLDMSDAKKIGYEFLKKNKDIERKQFQEPNFFGGMLQSSKEKDTDNSPYFLWSGVLVNKVYAIVPETLDIPELSVGFCFWTHRTKDDPDLVSLACAVKKHLEKSEDKMWDFEIKPDLQLPGESVFVIQTRLLLKDLNSLAEGAFWDMEARNFFDIALNFLLDLPQENWAAIEKLISEKHCFV